MDDFNDAQARQLRRLKQTHKEYQEVSEALKQLRVDRDKLIDSIFNGDMGQVFSERQLYIAADMAGTTIRQRKRAIARQNKAEESQPAD